jgi:hypothetical protein
MIARKTMCTLATLAATAALSVTGGALAQTAQAAEVDLDAMIMNGDGYDFGSTDGDWEVWDSEPDHHGELMWSYGNGQISAHLTGALWLDHVEDHCARMRLDYFDADGDTLATRYGGTVCSFDDDRDYWLVDLGEYSSPYIAELKVSIEKRTSPNGTFSTAVSSVHHPNINSDGAGVFLGGFDFGDDDWGGNEPNGQGTVSWRLEPNGELTPHVTGVLWLDDAEDACARMNIRYLTESGAFLTERAGGTVCSPDEDLHGWTVDLEPYTSNKIGGVTVQLQIETANGWWVIGTDTETTSCAPCSW